MHAPGQPTGAEWCARPHYEAILLVGALARNRDAPDFVANSV
jgi:hypothetical protein